MNLYEISKSLGEASAKISALDDALGRCITDLEGPDGEHARHVEALMAATADLSNIQTLVHEAGGALDDMQRLTPSEAVALFIHAGMPCIAALDGAVVRQIRRLDACELAYELERLGFAPRKMCMVAP